ncbi:MAG: hypothetical protein ACLT16_08750 [[Clostridium] innocuum]
MDELNGEAKYQTTTVNHVCADAAYGMKQSQKGIQPAGDLLVIIDMNDLVAFEGAKKRTYKEPLVFDSMEDTEAFFTLRPDVDLIVYKGHEYTVNSVGEVNPVSDEPDFLEIIANE